MRAFVALRQHALNYEVLATALKNLENNTNSRFAEVDQFLDALMRQKQQQEDFEQRRRIGLKSKIKLVVEQPSAPRHGSGTTQSEAQYCGSLNL